MEYSTHDHRYRLAASAVRYSKWLSFRAGPRLPNRAVSVIYSESAAPETNAAANPPYKYKVIPGGHIPICMALYALIMCSRRYYLCLKLNLSHELDLLFLASYLIIFT